MLLDEKDTLEELKDVVREELADMDVDEKDDVDKIVKEIEDSASLAQWKEEYAKGMIPESDDEVFELYAEYSDNLLPSAESYKNAYSILEALKKGIYDYVIDELDDLITDSLELIVEELLEEE